MPTVKWVDGWYDNKADVPVEVHGALTTVPWPVLTLADAKRWGWAVFWGGWICGLLFTQLCAWLVQTVWP